jgi:hypothetical protein
MSDRTIINENLKSLCVLTSLAMMLLMAPLALAADKIPEVDSHGLHLLKHTKVRIAYAKPGTDFSKYTEVKLLDCFVQFKKNWERDYNMDQVGLDGRVSDKDAETIKKRVADEFRKEFTKVLSKDGHTVVDDIGPNVLLLRPAIINLDVNAPDIMHAGMETTVVASAGQMTLYLELYDSATSALIGRIIDPKADQEGFAMRANRVTNIAAADRIMIRWAQLLSDHLGDVKANSGE